MAVLPRPWSRRWRSSTSVSQEYTSTSSAGVEVQRGTCRAKEERRRAGSLPTAPTEGQLRSAAARTDGEDAASPECAIPVANSVQSGIAANNRGANDRVRRGSAMDCSGNDRVCRDRRRVGRGGAGRRRRIDQALRRDLLAPERGASCRCAGGCAGRGGGSHRRGGHRTRRAQTSGPGGKAADQAAVARAAAGVHASRGAHRGAAVRQRAGAARGAGVGGQCDGQRGRGGPGRVRGAAAPGSQRSVSGDWPAGAGRGAPERGGGGCAGGGGARPDGDVGGGREGGAAGRGGCGGGVSPFFAFAARGGGAARIAERRLRLWTNAGGE